MIYKISNDKEKITSIRRDLKNTTRNYFYFNFHANKSENQMKWIIS